MTVTWTHEQTQRLIELCDGTRCLKDVGDALGMNTDAVVGKIFRLRKKGHNCPILRKNNGAGTLWTDAETELLAQLLIDGVTLNRMEARIGRSRHSIAARIHWLRTSVGGWPWSGIKPVMKGENYTKPAVKKEKKTRRCLSCGHDFTSLGKGNRLCNSCKAPASTIQDYSVTMQGWRF